MPDAASVARACRPGAGLDRISIVQAMVDRNLFGRQFAPAAWWTAWTVLLTALFGLPMTASQVAIYARHTARTTPPTAPATEAWLVVGRRGGKSRIAALVAVFVACFRSYRHILAPGERGVVMVLAADRDQAKVVLRYIAGLIDSVPMLAGLVSNRTAEAIHLRNGVSIEVHTASFRSIRGRTVVAAICDEIAFWRSEESANPDTEILAALRPAMATVPGALLLCISSPYARRGALWDAYQRHYGRDGDPVLVWQADTRTMHPSLDEDFIRQQYEQDPVSAAAEYGAEFRRDVEAFLSREILEPLIAVGRRSLPPRLGTTYHAFVDPSGGSHASMVLAIAHAERRTLSTVVLVDRIVEVQPPLSPDAVVAGFAPVLTEYRIRRVWGDGYAGEWPVDRFRQHSIAYDAAPLTKSDLFIETLPLFTSGRVELLDHERLIAQLLSLDRRTTRSGRDSIGKPRNGYDDVANAVAGAIYSAGRRQAPLVVAEESPEERDCRVCAGRHLPGECWQAAPTFEELHQWGIVSGPW